MQIIDVQCYAGRNIYSHKPVIRLTVDIGELYKSPTKDFEGFNERLLELFPGLKRHFCSLGYEGGFLERLKEGTYIGHVTEHLIIEIQNMLGYKVCYGKTRVVKEPYLYYIVFEYINEKCGIECARNSVDIMRKLIDKRSIDLDKILQNLRVVSTQTDLGPSTSALYEEAKKRGIPVMRIGNDSLLRLGYGKYSRLVQAALTDMPSCISVDIACNKELTKRILRDNKIPVPEGDVAYSIESAVQIANEIGYPVVIKPLDLSQGKGVVLNLNSESEVRSAYEEAIKYTKAVLVERYIKGRDYRILIIGGKVAAAAERTPPFVTGDGIHTVSELVDIENASQLRGNCHEKPLTKIRLDSMTKKVLNVQGFDETYIPLPEEKIFLRYNGNLSTGGTARNCTDELNPYNSALAVKAAKVLGLDIAGVDITTPDISKPVSGSNGAIIEVNAAPGLRMHLFPSEGEPVDVASDILDMMYPAGKESSIPIVSITGTNGKTTTTRLISHTLALCGKRVGMTSTSGIYIGNECILKGDNTGPVSAGIVLSNKEVEVAVLETARGGLVRKGLGYDLADVAVVTNISEDHLGCDGIETLEDLAFVKSLVIEAVKPEGYAVLNADDRFAAYFIERAVSSILLYSKDKNNPLVRAHMKSGGRAIYAEE
ncbi:MAG: cyanophycin synthetase, partial [Clostridiaceae bacterium]|nr:cyanophycin synthetase [Clostridiaceae bacterium]